MIKGILDAFMEGVTQEQREALVDLLVCTQFADQHLALAEQEQLEKEIKKLGWESGTAPGQFLNASVARAKSALEKDDLTTEYLREIAARLENGDARAKALAAAERMVGIDQNASPSEKVFLDMVRKVLSR